MKILFVTPYFAPAWSYGGPVKVVYDLARHFQQQGHRVVVATTDVLDRDHRHNQRQGDIDGIKVLYFPNVSNSLAFRFNAYWPRGFTAWAHQHLAEFDVIHCHDLFTWQNIVIARLAPKLRRPFFIQPHGALNSFRISSRLTWAKWLFLKIFSNVLGKAQAIFVSTAAEKDEEIAAINPAYPTKTIVVPNGLELTQLSMATKNSPVRSEYGLQPDELFLLYFGRIQYIKGIDIALRGLALIPNVRWKFVIIGRDDGALSELQRIVTENHLSDRIQFIGPVFGQQMNKILRSADVFLFTSRSEGLPMAALDACAAQLPLVFSAPCNVPEIAAHGAGIQLPTNTPTSVAAAVSALAAHPTQLAQMRQNCHDVIRDVFNLNTIAAQLLTIYVQATPSKTSAINSHG